MHQTIGRAYRLFPAYWTPETDLICLNLDQISQAIKNQDEQIDAIYSLVTHELIHAIGLRPYIGLIFNIRHFSSQSVKDMVDSDLNVDLSRIKEMMIKREVASDKLFLSSKNLVEASNAYVNQKFFSIQPEKFPFYKGILENILSDLLDKSHIESLEESVKRIKLKVSKLVGISVDDIPENVVARVRKEIIEEWPEEREEILEEFRQEAYENFYLSYRAFHILITQAILAREREVKEIYRKLECLEDSVGSLYALGSCLVPLDIPLIKKPESLLFEIDTHINPRKRFKLLMNTFSKIKQERENDKKEASDELSREELFKNILEQSVLEIFNQSTHEHALGGVDDYLAILKHARNEREFYLKFARSIKKDLKTIGKIKTLFATPSLQEKVLRYVRLGLLPLVGVISNRRFRIYFGKKFPKIKQWKYNWCLHELKKQLVCGTTISSPLDIGPFKASKRLQRKVQKATTLARRFESVPVPEWLLERFRETSKQVGRPLFWA